MLTHLAHAKHNEDFLDVIETHSPEKFYDWKIIVIFYCALHYLRGLEKLKKAKIKGTHSELIYHTDPSKSDAKMPIDSDVHACYSDLYNMTRVSRYTGFQDPKQFHTLMKFNLNLSKKHYAVIKSYCVMNGVKEK